MMHCPNLGDVAGNPWMKVLKERYVQDKIRQPRKYAKIENSRDYKVRRAYVDNRDQWVQTMSRQNREAQPHEGRVKKDASRPSVRAHQQKNRDWNRQNLHVFDLRMWCGFQMKNGHGTRQLRERRPDYFDVPRVLATDWYDTARRRYLLHRVYHLPFWTTLRSGVVVSGAMPLHPSVLNTMFVEQKTPGSFRDKVAAWIGKMSVAELRCVFPKTLSVLDAETTELFKDHLDPASLKLVYGPWPLEADPHPVNVWSDILWQRLDANEFKVKGKKDINPNGIQSVQQRRNRAVVVPSVVPVDKTKRATVGKPATTTAALTLITQPPPPLTVAAPVVVTSRLAGSIRPARYGRRSMSR